MRKEVHYARAMGSQNRAAELCAALNLIVRALVSDPDAVSVDVVEACSVATVIQVRAAKGQDTGKIIGKQGRTAHALRVILQAVAKEHSEKYRLDIAGTNSEEEI